MVISESSGYFLISFSVRPVHIENDHHLFPGAGFILLGSIGYDDKYG